jgi:dihydrolipoamide dehydrogenase
LKELSADKLLVAVGREANVVGFGLEQTGVHVDRGVIAVNGAMRTCVPNIYAIGDVIGGLQLAHVASHEGICAVETIAGKHSEPIDLTLVPRCIYGRPEIASVGITEQQAAERGHEVKTGKFSFKGIGKSLIYGSSDGFVKVVADARDNAILGVHMIGPHVTDYIGEASLAQLLGATTLQVGKMIHPHPTLSEIIGEAMLAADGAAIHM